MMMMSLLMMVMALSIVGLVVCICVFVCCLFLLLCFELWEEMGSDARIKREACTNKTNNARQGKASWAEGGWMARWTCARDGSSIVACAQKKQQARLRLAENWSVSIVDLILSWMIRLIWFTSKMRSRDRRLRDVNKCQNQPHKKQAIKPPWWSWSAVDVERNTTSD